MSIPRQLARPPIVEALVDLRARSSQPAEVLERLADELKPEFPKVRKLSEMKTVLQMKQGRLLPPKTDAIGFHGFRLESDDGRLVVQLQPTGFTFNNVGTYVGGDRLIGEALRLWSRFSERVKPDQVSRVALRYINRLELPLESGVAFKKFLTAAPESPKGAPQTVSEFLSRIVAHERQDNATVIVTQQLQHQHGRRPIITIDVDVFKEEGFSVAPDALQPVLERLRILKNDTFFALLTDETVSLYL